MPKIVIRPAANNINGVDIVAEDTINIKNGEIFVDGRFHSVMYGGCSLEIIEGVESHNGIQTEITIRKK